MGRDLGLARLEKYSQRQQTPNEAAQAPEAVPPPPVHSTEVRHVLKIKIIIHSE